MCEASTPSRRCSSLLSLRGINTSSTRSKSLTYATRYRSKNLINAFLSFDQAEGLFLSIINASQIKTFLELPYLIVVLYLYSQINEYQGNYVRALQAMNLNVWLVIKLKDHDELKREVISRSLQINKKVASINTDKEVLALLRGAERDPEILRAQGQPRIGGVVPELPEPQGVSQVQERVPQPELVHQEEDEGQRGEGEGRREGEESAGAEPVH